jgi:hypothetical protein
MAKGRNNSGNSKERQSNSSRNSEKSSTTSRRRSNTSKGGASHEDNNSSNRNYPSKGHNTNNEDSHHDSNRSSKVPTNNTSSQRDRGYTSKPGQSNDNDHSDNYEYRNNSKPINDPPPYEDADMNFTEEEVYGNTYSKNPDNEADMTFTEEEVYGNEDNDAADMTFTEEEVYGNTYNNRANNNEEPRHGTSNRIRSNFQICTPFAEYYLEFRETLVRNAPELRRQMISRSNSSHIGNVIDRAPDLRNIHREYRDAGTRPGQSICLNTRVIRDSRRYVSEIRFTAPDMHTFEDEPVVSDTGQRSQRELNILRRRFTSFTNRIIETVPTYFGNPDSHDITLASAISMYCNNMIRLSRGSRTMIPHEASTDVNRPIVRAAERDWDSLTNGNQRPALYRQDQRVIDTYKSWARRVLLEHGNTRDERTINNFVNSFNGYRNY